MKKKNLKAREMKSKQKYSDGSNRYEDFSSASYYSQDGNEIQNLQEKDLKEKRQKATPPQKYDKLSQKYSCSSSLSEQLEPKYSILPMGQEKTEKSLKQRSLQQNEIIDRLIVKRLCQQGKFNISSIRDELKIRKMQKLFELYFICRTISEEIVRGLQNYLVKICKIKSLKIISWDRMDIISRALMSCQQVLDSYNLATFIKCAKITYHLEDVELQKKPALSLHSKLTGLSEKVIAYTQKMQQGADNEAKNKSNNIFLKQKKIHPCVKALNIERQTSMNLINKIWTQQHNKYLRQAYKTTQGFGPITDLFIRKFPEHSKQWTPKTLYLRFCKLIRDAVKTLSIVARNLKNKMTIQDLVAIDDFLFQKIARSALGAPLRTPLIHFLDNIQNIPLVVRLIEQINQLQKESKKRRSNKKQDYQLSNYLDLQGINTFQKRSHLK